MKQKITSYLPEGHPWRERIHTYDILESTNTTAKELARQGAPEGTTLIARSQSAGRGRLGRSFFSPQDGGLYLSLVLRPDCVPGELMHLTCAVAVAACDAVEKVTGFRPGIKWINDLTWSGKKLGGILTELIMDREGKVAAAIVGIGINCHLPLERTPSELRELACSLSQITSEAPDRALLASRLILALDEMSQKLLTEKDEILEQYRLDCVTLGKPVRVISPAHTRHGTALALEPDGSLTVRFSDGHTEQVNSGEVSVRGLWDYV